MDEFEACLDPHDGPNNTLNVGVYAARHPSIVATLKPLRASEVIPAVGGLLTLADLQANCFRVEVLGHLAAAFCRGRISPTSGTIKSLFDGLGEGLCGMVEDPAECAFVGLTNTADGNFRIFEGLRDGASFYLQLILDVLESGPDQEPLNLIRKSVTSLLKLSEAVAERAGTPEYGLGQETPVPTLSDGITDSLVLTSSRVTFDLADVAALGIQVDDLSPFIFDPASGAALLEQDIGNSDLERYPLAECDGRFYLGLPTAVASAITRFVVESVKFLQIEKSFEATFAGKVITLMRGAPILGRLTSLHLARTTIDDCLIGYQLIEIDACHFLHFVVVFESLSMFGDKGLNGINYFSNKLNAGISEMVVAAHRAATEKTERADGLTLVIPAGIGRGFVYSLSDDLPKKWRVLGMPVHDLMTASWLENFDPLTLWRVDNAQDVLRSLGVILINQSGLLNLIGCTREMNGRILAEKTTSRLAPSGDQNIVLLPTNAHRRARRDAQERYGVRRALDIEGRWIRVQKLGGSLFEDGGLSEPFFSEEKLRDGELLGVCQTQKRAWWLSLKCNEDSSRPMAFEYWRALCLWLSQASVPLEDAYPRLRSGSFHFFFEFDEITASGTAAFRPRGEQELRELVEVTTSAGSPTVTIRVRAGFEDGFIQAQNIADRMLVEAMIRGVATSSGSPSESDRKRVLDEVCPPGDARRIHRWSTSNFRDFMQGTLSEAPIVPDSIDYATSLLGLGNRLSSFQIPCVISGKDNCMAAINGVVEILIKEIVSDLKKLNRRVFVEAVIRNYETAACCRDRWRYTSRALVAIHRDSDAAIRTIMQQNGKYNSCTVASRILLEAAICECALNSGATPGDLEIAQLMAKVMIVHEFGGWSAAIRWDAMAAEVHITPLGEIQSNVEFIEQVYQPFGQAGGQSSVERAIENYDSFFEHGEPEEPATSEMNIEFSAAWKEEFGVSIRAFRALTARLEELALQGRSSAIYLPASRLAAILSKEGSISEREAAGFLAFVTSSPRTSWFCVPEGFSLADWYPWRFRRRLAILRRPFLQLDETADPTILCAPGLIGDAFSSMIAWYLKGEIGKARTRPMELWLGRVNDVQRTKFNKTVAARLRQLGWNTKAEVKITEILGRSFDRDYGDVDVLAWRNDNGRTLAIECKDLQSQTTMAEVAEQLSDFRGETRANGKRDHLKRHLDRLAILSANSDVVARFLKLPAPLAIEGHLVFSRDVPMRFAWKHIANQVRLSLFEGLESI
jgi:hypothetical protein